MPAIERIAAGNAADAAPEAFKGESLFARFLKLMCSVRLGVTLLVLLGAACLTGMLIMQQNIDGFDRYLDGLTPAQRLVYGSLGFFNIYHSWYFNALLALVSLNIVLASFDRFPRSWVYVSKPTVAVPVRWLRERGQKAELTMEGSAARIAERASRAMKAAGWRSVLTHETNGRTYVFAQTGAWNRLGAYFVHAGLLTIFTGGFLTAQLGSTGQMPLRPGQTMNQMFDTVAADGQAREVTRQLPFYITCVDLWQKLIKKDGSLAAQNTIDWTTAFTIADETGTHEAQVQMNRPFDYRGYRFFHANFTPVGRARSIKISARAANGGGSHLLTIPRDGSASLPDGTIIDFTEFRGNFRTGPEDLSENTTDYKMPAAVIKITQPGAPPQTAYALGPRMRSIPLANETVAGYAFELTDFEKAADQHVLTVQYDPGANVVYVGFAMLFAALSGVFFFSHQRVWVAIEQGEKADRSVTIGGHANRNRNAFDGKFKRFVKELGSK